MALREIKALFLVLSLALLCFGVECSLFRARHILTYGVETVFDVTNYGAKPDGKTECSTALIKAWNATCKSSAPAKLLFPKGTFLAGEIVFQGPCNTPTPIIIEIQGTILSSTDLSLFTKPVWISIENVDGVIVTGEGTLDGQGDSTWQGATGDILPVSLQMENSQNGVIQNIKLVNSKGFHTKVSSCTNVTVTGLNISAPATSPNTDGLHVSRSQNVNVTNLTIGTGDDCISIGEGNTNIAISNITCGPGHGISIGSLGKRPEEKDVKGVTVKNCTLIGTTNGARIKTFQVSSPLLASGIVYEDIVMDQVKNPIIVDQHYNSNSEPSSVQISDVHFKNIRGTTGTQVAVNLDCNEANPCKGIELADIDLTPVSGIPHLSSTCSNVKPIFSGVFTPGKGSCQ